MRAGGALAAHLGTGGRRGQGQTRQCPTSGRKPRFSGEPCKRIKLVSFPKPLGGSRVQGAPWEGRARAQRGAGCTAGSLSLPSRLDTRMIFKGFDQPQVTSSEPGINLGRRPQEILSPAGGGQSHCSLWISPRPPQNAGEALEQSKGPDMLSAEAVCGNWSSAHPRTCPVSGQ